MAACKDQSIRYFNALGINVVRLPRETMTPLMVLVADPDKPSVATIYGHISEIVAHPTLPLPTVGKDLPVGSINGMRSSRLEFRVAIAFLKLILSALQGTSVGIEDAFQNVDQIEFEYTDVLYDTAMPTSVGNFLRSGEPNVDESLIDSFNAEGKAFIVIDVLKSNSLYFRTYRDDKPGGNVDLNVFRDAVGNDSGIIVEQLEDQKILLRGKQALGFGVKVCPFWVEQVDEQPVFQSRPVTNVFTGEIRGSSADGTPPELPEEENVASLLIAPNRLLRLIE